MEDVRASLGRQEGILNKLLAVWSQRLREDDVKLNDEVTLDIWLVVQWHTLSWHCLRVARPTTTRLP